MSPPMRDKEVEQKDSQLSQQQKQQQQQQQWQQWHMFASIYYDFALVINVGLICSTI